MKSVFSSPPSDRAEYIGIFAVALATLMQQIMITRLFSATMYYHFAFAIVSLTMLGMTIGALAVFLYSHRFPFKSDRENIAFFCAFFGMFSTIAILLQTSQEFLSSPTNLGLILNLLLFLPGFICSGIVITTLLTRRIVHVSRLYAADLCGAALGCVLTLWALDMLGAVNGLLLSASIPAAIAFMFAHQTDNMALRQRMLGFFLFIVGIMLLNLALTCVNSIYAFRIIHSKGLHWQTPEKEFWNSYSRITLYDMGVTPISKSCDGLGKGFTDYETEFKKIFIDSTASTVMMKYSGKPKEIDFLNYDITNSAYQFRKVNSAAVIGVGGGRDILSALAGGAQHILGIEMNNNIIRSLAKDYSDYAGISKDTRVELVNDEGRSYLTRQSKQFDLVQLSMIDTWAATAAGAFSLSENGLYTVEAWRGFMEKLTPNGMLAVTRWYRPKEFKDELYRLLSLARATLIEEGISAPREHVVVLSKESSWFASMIVSKSPVTKQEMQNLSRFADARGFKVILSPFTSDNDDLVSILESDTPTLQDPALRIDLTASRDNRPFFFNTLGFWQSIDGMLSKTVDVRIERDVVGMLSMNFRATEMLLYILFTVLVLTVTLVLLPLWHHTRHTTLPANNTPYLLYFAMLGMGFMFIEVTQMQRLMIFLGHPTYALVVVLCSLLVSSGIGSLATQHLTLRKAGYYLIILCVVLGVIGVITNPLLNHFRSDATPIRVSVALLTMLPIGFFMGMGFPFGMKLADADNRAAMTPWFWGVNGATSVLASVLALMVAMFNGINIAYGCGVACYVLAAIVFVRMHAKLARG